MAALAIRLLQPADGTVLVGSGVQRLAAALEAPPPVPLFFRWYSSLAPDPLGSALELPAAALPLGSQVITFAAKDQPLDTKEAVAAVRHAGMAGGPLEGGQPCRVHVLVADLRQPAAGAALNRAAAVLSARAPSQWGREQPPGSGQYVPNPDYLAIDQLRIRWRFVPSGPPAGRASGELVPAAAQLRFVPPQADGGGQPLVPLLRYTGPLPAGLGTGTYLLTLRVEHAAQPALAHEQSIGVTLG